MAISEVIEFKGSPDLLVWKARQENFNTTSQLIVDPTHEALLVMNGYAADLFGEGKHTLTTSNIPLLRRIIEIPTGGKTAFPCKIYYVSKVHQMDLLWGTRDPIPLEDPLYDIFLHVMVHGSLSYSIVDTRKFLLKLADLRDQFTNEQMVQKFRGIIAKHVKDCIAKIMINGKLSYFMISANLMEISDVLQERLSEVFLDYGIGIEFFNVETIAVPKDDYAAVSKAKERRTSRLIEGYTWQEERQMMIAEKFAGNEGTMGNMGGIMGGAVGGMVMGSTIAEVARNALSKDRIPNEAPPANVSGIAPAKGVNAVNNGATFDVAGFFGGAGSAQSAAPADQNPVQTQFTAAPAAAAVSQEAAAASGDTCPSCHQPLNPAWKVCPFCGKEIPVKVLRCRACGNELNPSWKVCPFCGTKTTQDNVCPGCGGTVMPGWKVCPACGRQLS